MEKTLFSDAYNFRQIDGRLATAGQPNEHHLASAAEHGVQVVINLGLHNDPRYSLEDEKGSVESLGMTYVHIPVEFGAPTEADLISFFEAMEANKERSVLVHCAANKRVTVFLGLYRVIRQGWSAHDAFEPMRTVWEPDHVWAQFINAMLARHAG